jgi:hypothetical protein
MQILSKAGLFTLSSFVFDILLDYFLHLASCRCKLDTYVRLLK